MEVNSNVAVHRHIHVRPLGSLCPPRHAKLIDYSVLAQPANYINYISINVYKRTHES